MCGVGECYCVMGVDDVCCVEICLENLFGKFDDEFWWGLRMV